MDWYHTLELAPGVVTPGWFDLRGLVDRMPMPSSMEGRRCLDVGTFDGFWAFEMERRGASEVIAIDILDPLQWDWPANSATETIEAINQRKAGGVGFEIARRELGSSVQRIEMSVHDLDPREVGRFDLVYLGSLLLHLRDPVGALERVRDVCDGTLITCDAIDGVLTAVFRRRPLAGLDAVGRPWWWKPNLAALVRMVESAGFELIEPPIRVRMPPGRGHLKPPINPRVLASRAARAEAISARRGDPHAIVHARPRRG